MLLDLIDDKAVHQLALRADVEAHLHPLDDVVLGVDVAIDVDPQEARLAKHQLALERRDRLKGDDTVP